MNNELIYQIYDKKEITGNLTEILSIEDYYWKKIRNMNSFKQFWDYYYDKSFEENHELLYALSEAYHFAYFSFDSISDITEKILKKLDYNNSERFLVEYFYFNIIHAIKKVLDTIGIITNNILELNIVYTQINLEYKMGVNDSKFYKKLMDKNIDIYNFLKNKKDFLNDFYDIRILVTHKYHYHILPGVPEYKFWVPKHAYLFTYNKTPKVGDHHNDLLIEINEKCNELLNNLNDIIQQVLIKLVKYIKK